MRPDLRGEGAQWLAQARDDLEAARLLRGGGHHNLACFHCQQAAEKALKAFLILRDEEDIGGHSVERLCERAAGLDDRFTELVNDAARLDVFYLPTRYPNALAGGLPSRAFGPEESERALELADRVVEAVERAFGES